MQPRRSGFTILVAAVASGEAGDHFDKLARRLAVPTLLDLHGSDQTAAVRRPWSKRSGPAGRRNNHQRIHVSATPEVDRAFGCSSVVEHNDVCAFEDAIAGLVHRRLEPGYTGGRYRVGQHRDRSGGIIDLDGR